MTKRAPRPPLTTKQVEEVRRLRDAGLALTTIASRMGISLSSASKYARGDGDTSESARRRLLVTIAEHGPIDSRDLIEHNPDIDLHATLHLCYSLAKAGLISYRESHNGTSLSLERIKATNRGFDEAKVSRVPPNAPLGAKWAPSLHPGENSDFRNLPSVAPGGPVTVRHIPPEPRPAKPEAPAAAVISQVPEPKPEPKPAAPRFPALYELSQRRHRIEEAANLLDSAGLSELAVRSLEALDNLTDIEREALELYALAIVAGFINETRGD